MEAVIYLELLEQPHWGYQKPLLQWVNSLYRNITTLDLDSRSDKMLIDYACRLVTESERCVVFVEAQPQAHFGNATRFLELLLQQGNNCLVLLHGKNERLQQIYAARPMLLFFQAEEEAPLRVKLKQYLEGNAIQAKP